MKLKTIQTLLGPALFGLVAHSAAAEQVTWTLLPAQATDMTSLTLAKADAIPEPTVNQQREAVAFSWPLTADSELSFAHSAFEQQSRQYWLDVTAAKLASGIDLALTAPGALIRITPADVAFGKIDQHQLQVLQAGKTVAAKAAIETLATADQLAATGADFGPGSLAFKLAPTLGSSDIALRVDGLAADAGRFVVHVFEPESATVLHLKASNSRYLSGGRGALQLSMDGAKMAAADFSGYLASPDGKLALPLEFTQRGTTVDVQFELPRAQAVGSGLWEVHTFLDTGAGPQRVMRDAATAFAVSAPVARLSGGIEQLTQTQFAVDLDVAAAGRYELRAVLFASNVDGDFEPAAIAHSARWLDPGHGQISLAFDATALADRDLAAPFELRHIELKDQSRLGDLWRQEHGFRQTAAPEQTVRGIREF